MLLGSRFVVLRYMHLAQTAMGDLPVDTSVVNSDVWSPSAINANPWPEVVVGLVLLVYGILGLIARRRDIADVVETKLKEKKWEQQMRANAKSASDANQTFTKIFKKRFQSLHLWLSIGYRPHGDCFTSFERVTCLVTFVYIDMALCAVGFGSDFASPMDVFWLIMIVSTVIALVTVQLCIVPFFAHSGPESARQEWLDRQKAEAARGRGLSIPVNDGPVVTPNGCDQCYGHCCGKRYPEWCKICGFVCCGAASLLAIFVTLNWGTKFVLHESGTETFGTSMNRYGLWIICCIISFVFDIIFLRPFVILITAAIVYCARDTTADAAAPASNAGLLPPVDAGTGIELHAGATAV